MFKVQFILILAGLLMVGGSKLYFQGRIDAAAEMDQQAFDSYVHFAKQMQGEVKAVKVQAQAKPEPTGSVWAALPEGK